MNRHISSAIELKRRPKILFLVLEILFVLVVPFMLAPFVQNVVMEYVVFPVINHFEELWYWSFRSMFFHITSFGFVILYIFFVVKIYEKRTILALGFFSNKTIQRGLFGFVIASLMMGMIVLLMLLFDQAVIQTDHLISSGIKASPYLLIILIGWLVQGSAEEIVFQGWLLPKIGKTFGIVIAVVGVSLLFALAHGLNPNMSIIASTNLVMYGLFASLYVLYERGIIGVMIFHASWNFLQGNVFGLAVSGGGLSGISYTSVRIEEQTIFNGGDFGAEGGLIASGVLFLGILVLTYLHKKRSKQNA